MEGANLNFLTHQKEFLLTLIVIYYEQNLHVFISVFIWY